ncbi:MAG: hypothetical protein ACTS6J_23760 [Burkholderiales bacterium]
MTAPLSGSLLAATAWFAIAVLSPVRPGIFLLAPDNGAQPGMKVK